MKFKNLWKSILSWALYIAVILCLASFVNAFVFERTTVEGHSMENTLHDHDSLVLDKITYHFRDPKRFDIIVFPHMLNNEKSYYIKRIIGLPGETLQISEEGSIYINGKMLKEDFGKEVILNPGIASKEIKLKDDEYFVMGDNRNNSQDSRDPSVGPVKREDIIGRAVFRLYPFNNIGVIQE